ncbi:MAG: ABC transporter substrate-binding protein [Opitutaceae bacterium]
MPIHSFRNLITIVLCLISSLGASAAIDYARNFEIEEHGTHKILKVHNAHSTSSIRYALVPKSQSLPKLPKGTVVIRTPVERVVVMETVYLGYLEAINALDTIVGAGSADFISNKKVQECVSNGSIRRVQMGQALNVEQLLLLKPDLILTSISEDPAFDLSSKLARTGLPVAVTAGYMEAHPLARAEWIKYIATFFETEALAEKTFQKVATNYESLKATVKEIENKPTVFAGAPYSGAWHVAAGKSYTAQAIRDAGGDYLWSDVESTGAIALDTERVFLKAANADIWIHPSFYRSFEALTAADARFQKFKAAQLKAVYNNTKQVGSNGGNAIWENGIVHPDTVLADMIKVFHPALMDSHEFVYYEQLK